MCHNLLDPNFTVENILLDVKKSTIKILSLIYYQKIKHLGFDLAWIPSIRLARLSQSCQIQMHTGSFSRCETKFLTLKREARDFLPSQSQGTVPWDEMVAGACVTHVSTHVSHRRRPQCQQSGSRGRWHLCSVWDPCHPQVNSGSNASEGMDFPEMVGSKGGGQEERAKFLPSCPFMATIRWWGPDEKWVFQLQMI